MTAAFRQMQPGDRPFVISGWSSSYRTSKYAGLLAMDTYAYVMHREVGRLLDHPRVATIVACEPGETIDGTKPFLYGFITVGIDPVQLGSAMVPHVLYVYVRTPYRRARSRLGASAGYATQLLEVAGVDPLAPFVYACETNVVSELSKLIPLAEFNSLPARFLEHHEQRIRSSSKEGSDRRDSAAQG